LQRMNLPDSFYIALCMTVLLLCVVYWFWTQNQYLLRKMNLLENIVYELKTVYKTPPPASAPSSAPMEPAVYAPAPSSVLEEDDRLHEELLAEEESKPILSSELPSLSVDELQPGGIGSGVQEEPSNALEGMTLKELRRLGDQRGIKGVAEMKKREILAQLKEMAPGVSVLKAFSEEENSLGADVVDLSN